MKPFQHLISVLVLLTSFCFSTTVSAIQDVVSFPVPDSVSFAGQNISLLRYDMHERFDREQTVIAYNHSNSLLIIKRANRIFPIIEPILKKHNIPDDFKYLAVIESNLDPRAISGAQAAGIWQLMPQTAKQFGLEVGDEVDERYHIQKSTEAVCTYLNNAFDKFKNWTTVAASYNAGMNRIFTEKNKQQVDNSFDMLLSSESSRYVFRILAMKLFLKDPKIYGYTLKKENFYQQINCHQVRLNTAVDDWTVWAAQYGLTYSELKDFNVWLRDRKLTNADKKEYLICIPEKSDMNFNPLKIIIHNLNWITN
jgi:hypothetical protein